MNERLAKTEAELVLTKDELAATKDALAKAVIDQTEAYTITKEALMSKTDELEREVAILKAPPYIHACGSHGSFLSGSSGTITYTSLLYSSTNTEGGGLDITTGVFTAPWGGSYTVSWDASAELHHGEEVYIILHKNGEYIKESYHHSYYGGNNFAYDQGKSYYNYYYTINCILYYRWPYYGAVSCYGGYSA